jgi:hypothetical protein
MPSPSTDRSADEASIRVVISVGIALEKVAFSSIERWNSVASRQLSNMARTAAKAKSHSAPPRTHDRRSRSCVAAARRQLAREALRARKKFLRIFPGGFRNEDFVDLERAYKWNAHLAWQAALDQNSFSKLLADGEFRRAAAMAVRIKSRTNLLFSFEKMALRDALKPPPAAKAFAIALYDLLHGIEPLEQRFSAWVETIASLPRRQTRVLTWPLATVFGFIAQPETHFFLKPTVTREAARRYGETPPYSSHPSWPVYSALLKFVGRVRRDIRDLRPRDMIDMQSFLWIQGSEEYPD